MRQQPQQRIAIKGLTVWRVYGFIQTIIMALIAGGASFLVYTYDKPKWIYLLIWGIVIIIAILTIFVLPRIRWERWRYDVREQEIEIQHGVFIVKRTLIPMVRVQHVDTAQGPILKNYKLSNISITTAATTHTIPVLETVEADELRAKISELARVAEDDV